MGLQTIYYSGSEHCRKIIARTYTELTSNCGRRVLEGILDAARRKGEKVNWFNAWMLSVRRAEGDVVYRIF